MVHKNIIWSQGWKNVIFISAGLQRYISVERTINATAGKSFESIKRLTVIAGFKSRGVVSFPINPLKRGFIFLQLNHEKRMFVWYKEKQQSAQCQRWVHKKVIKMGFWRIRTSCFSGSTDMLAKCFVISIVKEREVGFKESQEATINVIPAFGFSDNELGDHIPILKLIPITLSCITRKQEPHHLRKKESNIDTCHSLSTASEHVEACNTILANDS